MGKPINKPIPKSTPLMSYGKKKMRPEYWFSVPLNKVDEVYLFLNVWVPHLYGDLNEDQVSFSKKSTGDCETLNLFEACREICAYF